MNFTLTPELVRSLSGLALKRAEDGTPYDLLATLYELIEKEDAAAGYPGRIPQDPDAENLFGLNRLVGSDDEESPSGPRDVGELPS